MFKIKNINTKKVIKATTLIVGLVLIIFSSFFNARFDFLNFQWLDWLANSSILVGIMIFGILLGTSIGSDIQKEKVNGRFQMACNDYNTIIVAIEQIRIFFSQWWLHYKEKKLIEKKIDYLVEHQFKTMVAEVIVKNIEKEDLFIGKLGLDINDLNNTIYIKNGIKIKKLDEEDLKLVKDTFSIKLDTFGESYYLALFDDEEATTNEAEKGKKIAQKIVRDKRNNYLLKIVSSLVISIIWSALTINEFASGGGDDAVRKAWFNLLSRLCAFITSFVSGYSTSVINVRDQANAIENKTSILKQFKFSLDNKMFVPETYEQMIEREFKEQKNKKEELIVETAT